MPGSSFYASFNGRRYALPEDLDPMISMGGLANKEALRNGDGSADPQKTVAPGAIRGLSVRVRENNGDVEGLKALMGLEGVSMVYSGPDGVYAGTGFLVVGEDGIVTGQSEGKTEDFDFICQNGQGLERR